VKIAVLIPSFNEAGAISGLVTELKKRGLDVIVIDDGSKDRTAEAAREAGAVIIRHGQNLGKGRAIKSGFEAALRSPDYEAVIIMDGDGHHDPADIDNMIRTAREKNADIVMGNRMDSSELMPLVRLWTNRAMSAFLSRICGVDIPDTQCGFRLIRRRVIESVRLKSNNYDLESELLIRASRNHFRIASCPVRTIYGAEKSDIHPVRDALRFIFLIFRLSFKKD